MTTALCVLGMHRSGTSLLMQMLSRCGVYAGEDERIGRPGGDDNPSGYWEHPGFRRLNDRILGELGGSWRSVPPLDGGWAASRLGLQALEQEARTLLDRFRDRPLWGWKDPRNALTLPFWRSRIPDLRGVVIFRNPIQVAMSMQERRTRGNLDFSVPFDAALDLWLTYYEGIRTHIEALPGHVIVHYEALLHDPQEELRRIFASLDIPCEEPRLKDGAAPVQAALHRNAVSDSILPVAGLAPAIIDMYRSLCDAAGPTCRGIMNDGDYQRARRETDAGFLYRKLVEAWAANERGQGADAEAVPKREAPARPIGLADVDIVVVHYRHARPTVAMLNALFRHYPEAEVTLVDNSGGACPVVETVLPHLARYAGRIRLLVNEAGDPGDGDRFSHGAGIDLARRQCRRPYLLSMETDSFVLDRGCIEFAMSLMDAGYGWAGLGQKPVDGSFVSFSPSFAIFRVDLLQAYDLSFRRRERSDHDRDSSDPLIRHHRLAAERARAGLPLDYPDGKPPDTYRRAPEKIAAIEMAHEAYFDTGEWVHRVLSEKGHRGYLFRSPPSLRHTWGSRSETLFLTNFRHHLPEVDLNDFLPPALHVAIDLERLNSPCLAFVDPETTTVAEHWVWKGEPAGSVAVDDGSGVRVQVEAGAEGKVYLVMGPGRQSEPPPESLGAEMAANAFCKIECNLKTSATLRAALWVIEYGEGRRIRHHTCTRPVDGRYRLEFVSGPTTDSYRVLFRFAGTGSARIADLAMWSGR